MANQILDARQMVKKTTPAQWQAKQRAIMATDRSLGFRPSRSEVTTPVYARIDDGRWLFDCVCGAGVAAYDQWPRAYCLGENCGRCYSQVIFPANKAEIEAAALAQAPSARFWYPGEAVEDIAKAGLSEMWARYHRFREGVA